MSCSLVADAGAGGATALRARLEKETSQPFDLFKDRMLMRALLVSAGPEESMLLVCVHHAGDALPWTSESVH